VNPPRIRPTLAVLLAVFAALLATGCDGSPSAAATSRRAFYFWRTTFGLSTVECDALASLQVQRLYLRLFDMDRDATGPVPVGVITFPADQSLPPGVEIVPVVFLRASRCASCKSTATGPT
jgi:hypothetical protein